MFLGPICLWNCHPFTLMLCLSLFVVCIFLGFIQYYKSCILIQSLNLELYIGNWHHQYWELLMNGVFIDFILFVIILWNVTLFWFIGLGLCMFIFPPCGTFLQTEVFLIVPSILMDCEVYIVKFSFTLKNIFLHLFWFKVFLHVVVLAGICGFLLFIYFNTL